MTVLATMFGGTYAALSGPSKAPAAAPPINASSSDEADFIKYEDIPNPGVMLRHILTLPQEILGPGGSGR
jgi:hypothetical protein